MQYLKKEANNEVYLHAHNTIKMIVDTIILGVRSRHAQSSQNKKFTYLCNSPKNVGNEVNFLATNKYQNFLQIGNITLGLRNLPFPNYPK